ncbi:MAG: hypothetical protein EBS96_07180, partial [Spartobacteria bacterium]|nr:hypothetical protein [Spartobacteria bacterium]
MNQEPDAPTDLSGLEMDLAKSFQPAWVKETSSIEKLARFADSDRSFESNDRGSRFSDSRDGRRDTRPRKPSSPQRPREGDRNAGASPKSRRPEGRPSGSRPDPRSERRDDPRRESSSQPRETFLEGWEVKFIPEPRGIEGLTKQIKSTAKAYGLFELARLVLEKSPRYLVEFTRKSGPALFRCVADGTLWFSERDALAHTLASQISVFYTTETVTVEPPKGAFPYIAQCGMSDVLIGPPNHHDYQSKLRKIHSERFANMPFEAYASRVRMVREEAVIQKWKDEQCTQSVYHPIETPEGAEPITLQNLDEVEAHFLKNHATTAVQSAGDSCTIPGSAAVNDSAQPVFVFVRRELDNLIRFPLPIAHVIGQELSSRGLQIFKAHENVTYISVARPRPLDRQATPVSETLAAILDYLERSPQPARAEQWKSLLALPQLAPNGDDAAREAALLKELFWLLHQGHVIDFAAKGIEVARRHSARTQETPPAGASVKKTRPQGPVAVKP